MSNTAPNVLSIAGVDPSGGAGILADIKTFSALGAYGMGAVASLTVQNTQGVRAVHLPAAQFLTDQLEALSDDAKISSLKIGMLGNAANIQAVSAWLAARKAEAEPPFAVLDPVMVATSGDRLLESAAEAELLKLARLADLVTPNLPELAALLGVSPAADLPGALKQAQDLAAKLQTNVYAKGGHFESGEEQASDALVAPDGTYQIISEPWVQTRNTHGTGCALSAALAALRPQTESWHAAATGAKLWLTGALKTGGQIAAGKGRGPANHLYKRSFLDIAAAKTAAIQAKIERMEFIERLSNGSLPKEQFANYLIQDNIYLETYLPLLARASELADTAQEKAFWLLAAGPQNGEPIEEVQMHYAWLDENFPKWRNEPAKPSATTAAYLKTLEEAAGSGNYALLVAALLPCGYLYQKVCESIANLSKINAADLEANPYGKWIELYTAPGFAETVSQMAAAANRLFELESAPTRAKMLDYYTQAAQLEFAFFDQ